MEDILEVVPMEDINLHFTGDFHAIGAAHNLLSALIDNHIHWGNQLGIDARRMQWKRVIDMNDGALKINNLWIRLAKEITFQGRRVTT